MKIEFKKIGDIYPYQRNAKKHDKRQIDNVAESIKQFGMVQPIVIDKDNNVIIGHCRLLACKKLKMRNVPVVKLEDLTPEEANKLRLLDNKLNESDWDFDLLAEDIPTLNFDGFDIDWGIDFDTEEELTEIIEDEAPEDVETRCKTGDLWQLGEHRLICGDSTNAETIKKIMNGEKADISITSPPYGESNSAGIRDHYQKGKKRIDTLYKSHDDNISNWYDLIEGSFMSMQIASMAQFINIQMLADNKRDLIHFLDANKDYFVDLIIWDKKKAPPQMESNILNKGFEFVFCFYQKGCSSKIPFGDFHGNINNIFELSAGHNEYADIHRAVYPVEFPSIILQIAKKAQSVFDPFGGTGTTMIACQQLNRKCYMAELDPHYCDVIIQRWENLTGKKAVRIDGNEEGQTD